MKSSSTRLNSVSQNSGPFLLSSFCTIGFQTDAGLQATTALAIHACVSRWSRSTQSQGQVAAEAAADHGVIRSFERTSPRGEINAGSGPSSSTKATTNSSMKSSTGVADRAV